jgi:hypothetical protein
MAAGTFLRAWKPRRKSMVGGALDSLRRCRLRRLSPPEPSDCGTRGKRATPIRWGAIPPPEVVCHAQSRSFTHPDDARTRTGYMIVQSWKSFTASQANRLLRRTGSFWMADYHDRHIRDERHLTTVRAYIRNNPVKARLCVQPDDWRFGSAWRGRQWQG